MSGGAIFRTAGATGLEIENGNFSGLRDYQHSLDENAASIRSIPPRARQAAFERRSARNGHAAGTLAGEGALPDTGNPQQRPIHVPDGGRVWLEAPPRRQHLEGFMFRAGPNHREGVRHRNDRGHEDRVSGIEAPRPESCAPQVYVQERQPITPGTPIIALEPMKQ